MKFTVGDKIILKRTGEEGSVKAIIDKQMLEVEVNGISFPTYADEVDHPYLEWFTKKKVIKKTTAEQLPVEKVKTRKARLPKGVYLSFLPVFKMDEFEDVVDYVKVHLLNELPVSIQFIYDVRLQHESEFKHEGTLHAFGDLYLHNIPFTDMSAQPRFHWMLRDAVNEEMEIKEDILRIRPQKLFEHITELLQKNEPTFSYLLIDDFEIKKKEEKKETYKAPTPKPRTLNLQNFAQHMEAPKYELDLHIEKLVKNKRGLSNSDIIKIQLDELQKYLTLAIVHRQERMIVVHGHGAGVLRDAVHKMLRETREVTRYENMYHGGATEVFFKR